MDSDGNIVEIFSKFLKPKKFPYISKFCNELTTITQEDIDKADNAAIVLDEFFEFIQDSTLISWGHYDLRQLRDDFKLNGMKDLLDEIPQHYSLKHLYAEWHGLRENGIGMDQALKREKIELDGTHHRGIDDAKNIAKIFKKYIHKFL